MKRQTISCANCRRAWNVASAFTLYEQQAVESRPCPACGAYTLRCPETAWKDYIRVGRGKKVSGRS